MPAVSSKTKSTSRLRMHYLESGPDDGVPVALIHGNLSTALFYQPLMESMPDRYRVIAPDMRGFGDTERVPLDASRSVRDWADDTASLLEALGITAPPHLAGWSTGGAAIAFYAMDRPVASLTFIDPVAPWGFGGTFRDGRPCFPDFAGSGGGAAAPELVQRLRDGDASEESQFSPRNVMNAFYWRADHREPKEREDALVEGLLKSAIGDEWYPGDMAASANWPGLAPGDHGILNALSPKYTDWSGIVDLTPKPPVLWTHGTADQVINDGSPLDLATLGQMGVVPGWPGADVIPPQPMLTQIRDVLTTYREKGGRVEMEMFEGSGHFPVADSFERWRKLYFDFLASVR